ncbi:hypothetical protein L5515_012464 [Caenorhabditis briggsae]|uniref:Uncharacterized protein n=1 Tax=Caenorhabditis briggsae TaxID=6238 RepID=A0AAE9JG92_CAEBR|nr:hypothetical protein L5515_012464 [Caenorhabditis briggsae]
MASTSFWLDLPSLFIIVDLAYLVVSTTSSCMSSSSSSLLSSASSIRNPGFWSSKGDLFDCVISSMDRTILSALILVVRQIYQNPILVHYHVTKFFWSVRIVDDSIKEIDDETDCF